MHNGMASLKKKRYGNVHTFILAAIYNNFFFINSYFVSQNMCFPFIFPVSIICYKYDPYILVHTAISCHTRHFTQML